MLWIICQGCGFATAHFDLWGHPLRLFRDAFGREVCGSCLAATHSA